MSISIMSAVWQLQDLSHTEKLVLLALADNANDEGVCWPAVDTLSRKCSLNKSTISEVIDRLNDYGFVQRKKRFSASVIYTVSVPAVKWGERLMASPSPVSGPAVSNHHRTIINKPIEGTSLFVDAMPNEKPPATESNDAKSKSRNARTIPDAWQPHEKHRAKCIALGFVVEGLAEQFRHHHTARGTKFKDWDAGFHTWIGNASRFGGEKIGGNNSNRNKSNDRGILAAGLRAANRFQEKI